MIKGYYCIIQYCPDLSRMEAANIGVILFCPEVRFIRAKTAAGNDRLRRFFGPEPRDWERIALIKSSVEKRLESDAGAFRTLADLEHFRQTRANDIQLTPPRSLLVEKPESELDRLFELLVGGRAKTTTRESAAPIKRKLSVEFKRAKVEHFLRENLSIEVPVFHRRIEVPYGYQNGRFNLLLPVKFEQSYNRRCSQQCLPICRRGSFTVYVSRQEVGRYATEHRGFILRSSTRISQNGA